MKNIFISLDLVGFLSSLLCAIHCGGIPLLISFTSLSGLGYLNNPWIEITLILFSLIIASYALIIGYKRCHHRPLALIIVIIGFVLILVGHTSSSGWFEITFSTLGTVAIASAHFVNWKFIRYEYLKKSTN
ncbi:MAG: MerC domain-containing protein [Reichenbachiella sp.]|uniref:MerC domain-containing protein n=1 Tax=Reichenbachiella sp. TaxID=2184521 RepID=UPI003296E729